MEQGMELQSQNLNPVLQTIKIHMLKLSTHMNQVVCTWNQLMKHAVLSDFLQLTQKAF
jgi:hypothetical protein